MQGKRSAIGSLPDSINFDYGSSSNNVGIEQPICWNTLLDPAEARLSEFHTSEGNISQETRNLSRWNIGEPNPRNLQTLNNHDERISQNGWSSSMVTSVGAGPRLDDQVYDPTSNVVSRNGVNLNLNSSFVQTSNNGSTSQGPEINVTHRPSTSLDPFASSSRSGSFLVEEDDNRSDYLLDGRRLSCKRKNIEGSVEQSSSSGSSFSRDGGSIWQAQTLPPPHSNTEDRSLNASANPRLRLSIGEVAPSSVYAPNTTVGGETSRRNYRVRMNPRSEQDSLQNNSVLPINPPVAHNRPLRFVPINPPTEIIPPIQPVQRNDASLHQDLNSRPVPRNISEHPMFMPSVEVRPSLGHNPTWNGNGGGFGTSRNGASSSRAGAAVPGFGPQSSSGPTWGSHRRTSSSLSPQYSRRLSEYVRRSLLSSGGSDSGLHNTVSPSVPRASVPSSSSPQERIHSTGGPPGQNSHGDGVPAIPYALRALAAGGGEGRSRLMSEQIRTVLDMMRRGEGLRFEDVMFLDPSVFFGMADIHDEHRDMRLDIDNMSYEELLALEERIGNVSTGLPDEKIMARLKQKLYLPVMSLDEDEAEVEPCCVCQEVYKHGEDIGTLDCGHDFHAKCIKQWLGQKNSCPICKTTGLAT